MNELFAAKHRRRAPLALALFAVLFAQVLLAIGLVTGLGAFNLKQGFKDYQIARDTELLEGFVAIAARRIQSQGGLRAFVEADGSMREVMDELAIKQGTKPLPPPPPPPEFGKTPDRMPPQKRRGRPENFGARVALFSLEGQQIDGFLMKLPAATIERQVVVDGKPVAVAKVQMIDVPDAVELKFLRGQTNALMTTSLVLIIISAIASWLIAQLWSRPLNAMQLATSRIAEGEFSVRAPVEGLREVAETADNINHMANALQRLEAARRVWLAEISHELRTPVTIMLGELESLIDGVRQASPTAMASLHEEVLALTRLIDDLHVIALGDSGRLPCRFENVALGALVETAVRRFTPQIEAQGLSLVAAHMGVTDVEVYTDPYRLSQVLANVLGNSLRYTQSPGEILVSLRRTSQIVEIQIEDTPPGVSDDALEDMFKTFQRLDPSRTKTSGGSGLGLAVSRTIVSAVGGEIIASHAKSGGVCITITLPASGPQR